MPSIEDLQKRRCFSFYNITPTKIASGGFGSIYQAIGNADMNKGVFYAFKVLLDAPTLVKKHNVFGGILEEAEEDRNKRFNREWEMLKFLPEQHENIRVPRVTEVDPDNFCLMMTWIEGQTLRNILENEKNPSNKTIKLFLEDVLETLGKIHSSNIIHRDLQPSNLIREENTGKFFIIDFGMAIKKSEVGQQSTLLMDYRSARYYSQESGKDPKKLCEASDILSLGAITISWLSNIPLNEPKPTDSSALHEEWKKSLLVVWEEYRRKNQVHQKLGDILSKMVAENVGDRYQSCDEVVTALDGITIEEPTIQGSLYSWTGMMDYASFFLENLPPSN